MELADSISHRCNSRLANISSGDRLESGSKHVVCVNMPDVHESGVDRKATMVEHGEFPFDSLYPSHEIAQRVVSPKT